MTFKNQISVKHLKTSLMLLSVVLGTCLLFFIIFGFYVIIPKNLSYTTSKEQYFLFDLNNLPTNTNLLDTAYLRSDCDQTTDTTPNLKHKLSQGVYKKPRIAILIGNLGLNFESMSKAIALPKQVGLGIIPYLDQSKQLLQQAKGYNHEVYVNLPLEMGIKFDKHNPNVLRADLSLEENVIRAQGVLNTHDAYTGAYINNKEQMLGKVDHFIKILDILRTKNFLLIFGRNDKLYSQYLNNQIMSANIVIDEDLDEDKIKLNLNKLIQIAKKEKVALGYSQGYLLTINIMQKWIQMLSENAEVDLVYISELNND